MEAIATDILVVGAGTGGTAAAIQAARRGANVVLAMEGPWLGGMLTAAGVCAPDGNELLSFQTGIWGEFLRGLRVRQKGGLDNAWVSFFTYEPAIGAQIFADWAAALPNLTLLQTGAPRSVERSGNSITGATFDEYQVTAKIIIDGTELGDLLALGGVPYRWGWDWDEAGTQPKWDEPSAPDGPSDRTAKYSVQSPTWVVYLQDFGEGAIAPQVPAPPNYDPTSFDGAWENYGFETFLNYGRIPGNRFMLNWPKRGNDYGWGCDRLVNSWGDREAFWQDAIHYSQGFVHYIQNNAPEGKRYGLAQGLFPSAKFGGDGFALMPYYRESRRLIGLETVTEQDILPVKEGQAAALPRDNTGRCGAIAVGNYANDHHYPNWDYQLAPKSLQWGGRWTGTPFAMPYGCLVPATVDGLLVCDKNASVSHMANGATRLQPVVTALGQAAGMAAALCVEQNCQPRELAVEYVQEALLGDPIAPAAVIPSFDGLTENHGGDQKNWLKQQRKFCVSPDTYPSNGCCGEATPPKPSETATIARGSVEREDANQVYLWTDPTHGWANQRWQLVTLHPSVAHQLAQLQHGQFIGVKAHPNSSGNWLLVEAVND
ncbi:MAG: FAD-dependent oxidoreductase [Cyanophyceae cyanobacterium]